MMRTITALFTLAQTLIAQLIRSDTTNWGPRVHPESVPFAKEWLTRILVDSESFLEHISLLEREYQSVSTPPQLRRDRWDGEEAPEPDPSAGFPYYERLPDATIEKMLLDGLDGLDARQLGELLLNPFALCHLAEEIDSRFPDYWLSCMAEVGEEVRRPREAESRWTTCATRLDAQAALAEGDNWILLFNDNQTLARQVAQELYGSSKKPAALLLQPTHDANTDTVHLQLIVAPEPQTREPFPLTITFPTGDVRTFTVQTRSSHRDGEGVASEPCAPLPKEAMQLDGNAAWQDTWPPHLEYQRIEKPSTK